ncbi:Olfactory receptor 7A17 [Tupaia chinensis]|uniref:Olfactory receptor 7A17 n=1 Tax=Tupaia chinensis TaxID=246437 RepID=L8YD49_TUPCH|nr:Olfactory receptor 7A17 [Tupaia chinensis]
MEPENNTQNSGYLLLGFSEKSKLQPFIFWLFFSMYLITVCGNLLIILATISDSHLHTPMYFFLSNLSFVEICFTSTTVPKMLVNIQTQSKVITYVGCITQLFFSILFAGVDDFLLSVMAYDRYVAICHPLHYTVIMNPWLCVLLVLASWIMSALYSLSQSLMVLRLSFCANLEIPHFFCELNQVVHLACSHTFFNDMVLYFSAVLLGGLGVYLSPDATQSSHSSAAASVMYTVVTPMLNPFIYSLRNKDIKRALKIVFGGKLWKL